jgi:hypothetical protein
LPLLWAASITSWKAGLGGDFQGYYNVVHNPLMRAQMMANLACAAAIAESVGLIAQRQVADVQSPKITAALDAARAIAELFEF